MRQRIGYTDVSAVVQPDAATSLKNEMTTPSNARVEPGLSAEASGLMVHLTTLSTPTTPNAAAA